MTNYYKTPGIIIKSREYGEADRIFTVFTKEFGKLSLWAISQRKIASKLRGGLALFSVLEIEFVQGKSKRILTDAMTMASVMGIQKDLRKLQVGWKIMSLVDLLIHEEGGDSRVWHLLQDSFRVLNKYEKGDPSIGSLYQYFAWNLLSLLGYRPHLAGCIYCKQPPGEIAMYFLFSRGGLLCERCANSGNIQKGLRERHIRRVSAVTVDAIAKMLEGANAVTDESSLSRITQSFISHIISSRV
ncbi:MAG: DNA repair protein RecO [Candidatus Wildermuthbacteria bacterium]|nr:DNA repair protein RecO [Candidatus Wildermuthbacteria bacterium]